MKNEETPSSPLPWEWQHWDGYAQIYHSGRSDSIIDGQVAMVDTDLGEPVDDARYIVAACNGYPAALERIAALEGQLAGLRARLADK